MKSILTLTVCAMMLAFTAPATAFLGFPETLEGTVESVNEDALAIMSEDGTSQQMVEIQIINETKFEKMASLENLNKGDKVKIQYKKEGDDKIAISISKITQESKKASSDYQS